jgi:DNA polymerase-3 subunit chi
MWQYPEGRFLPHSVAGGEDSGKAPVQIGTLSDLNPTDVVINLCLEAVPQPERFRRLLEIVPYADSERQASRVKYRTYRNLGITPQTHEINT